MRFPGHQVRKGQPRPAELVIHPEAEVRQGDLGGQARLQPAQLMGPFPIQAEGMLELRVDGLHTLADAREPAPPRLGPRPLPVPPGWAEDLGAGGRPPRRMVRLALTALVDDLRSHRGRPHTGQAWLGLAAQGNKGFRQCLILGAGRPTAQAGAHAGRGHGQQPRDAFIPAQVVAPTHIGPPRQPARAPTLGLPGRAPGALEGFRGTALGRQEPDKRQKKGDQGGVLPTALSMVWLPRGQRRQGGPEMPLGLAIKAPRTPKTLPRPAQGQGDDLTPAQGGLGAWGWLGGQRSLAKVIRHNVQNRQEGVHIAQRHAPCRGEERAVLPAGGTFRVAIRGQLTPSV